MPAGKVFHIEKISGTCDSFGHVSAVSAGQGNGWKNIHGQNVAVGTPMSNITIQSTKNHTAIGLKATVTCGTSGINPLDSGAYGVIRYCDVTPPPAPHGPSVTFGCSKASMIAYWSTTPGGTLLNVGLGMKAGVDPFNQGVNDVEVELPGGSKFKINSFGSSEIGRAHV